MNRIIRHLHENRWIHVILLAFLMASLVVWRCAPWKDIGSNLFAGAIQLYFTFFIFERFVSSLKEQRDLPRQLSAYEDVCIWFNQMVSFYQDAYRTATGGPPPQQIEQICRKEFFDGVGRKNIDDEAPAFPARKWEVWIAEKGKEFSETGQTILDRDGERLPPEICRAIHALIRGPFLGGQRLITNIRTISEKHLLKGVKPVLWRYVGIPPSTEDFDSLREVNRWLEAFYKENVKADPKLVRAIVR